MDFTFGIITTNDNSMLLQSVESIRNLKIPNYEIVIVGNSTIAGEDINAIPFDESIKMNWITRKKNIITDVAKYDNIVYLHDYILFNNDWYVGYLKIGENFKICTNRIFNKDGSRFRDWCTCIGPTDDTEDIYELHGLLPYDVVHLSKYMYVSGAYWVAKKSVMKEFPLNENLCWGEGEDVEWSKRIRQRYDFTLNMHSTVTLAKNKPMYHSLIDSDTINKMTDIRNRQNDR